MKKYTVVLAAVAAALMLMVVAGSATARPVPQPLKVCSAYAQGTLPRRHRAPA